MIEYGRSIRWFNDYTAEVEFSKSTNFDFMQIWYVKGEILLDKVLSPKELHILKSNFPVMIHAVYDIDDYDTYTDKLIRILNFLGHNEVIIHPVCESQNVNKDTIYTIADKIHKTNLLLNQNNIKLYIENNSVIDKINYKPEDLKIVFDKNPDVELLLDVAHIDDYVHLEKIIDVKYPTCLHIADKRFNVLHEHLPLGKGELDFNLIFKKYLHEFDGKIIFEVVDTDELILNSKRTIELILNNNNQNHLR
ncbi:TIM barrel protein [Haloplasma contractile]|nr:TIM barrel protein [Haloplasma contractile]